jgi:hypothetical protein
MSHVNPVEILGLDKVSFERQAEPHNMVVVQNMEKVSDQTEEIFHFLLVLVTYYVKRLFQFNIVLIYRHIICKSKLSAMFVSNK